MTQVVATVLVDRTVTNAAAPSQSRPWGIRRHLFEGTDIHCHRPVVDAVGVLRGPSPSLWSRAPEAQRLVSLPALLDVRKSAFHEHFAAALGLPLGFGSRSLTLRVRVRIVRRADRGHGLVPAQTFPARIRMSGPDRPGRGGFVNDEGRVDGGEEDGDNDDEVAI